jgi:hypothetical protein
MVVLGAAVVVTFEAGATTYAVAWDGGEIATVHVVDDGRYGPAVERWEMHHPTLGYAVIPCTPAALLELVQFRLADTSGEPALAAVAGHLEPVEQNTGRGPWRLPEFSNN